MPNQKLNFLDALAARSGHRNEMFTGKFNTCLIKRQSAGMDPLTFAPSPLLCERQLMPGGVEAIPGYKNKRHKLRIMELRIKSSLGHW